MEKAGLKREAHFRQNIYFHKDEYGVPVWKDTFVYAITENDHLPGNNPVWEKNMNLKLIKLTREYEKQLGEMIDEWKADQELNHTNGSPGAIFKNDYYDFDYYLENLELKTPTDGKVPDSVFFLLDEDRDRLLGAVNIRHYLNDYLLKEGGHIGDGIRPSERRKGYATEMIRLALIECKKLGIDKVLMTCDKDNIGSAKSIIKNGGVLENEFINSEGVTEQRYWITI